MTGVQGGDFSEGRAGRGENRKRSGRSRDVRGNAVTGGLNCNRGKGSEKGSIIGYSFFLGRARLVACEDTLSEGDSSNPYVSILPFG